MVLMAARTHLEAESALHLVRAVSLGMADQTKTEAQSQVQQLVRLAYPEGR